MPPSGSPAPRPFGGAWSATHRRATEAELRRWLEIAQACADAADQLARASFRRDLVIDRKPDRTFVTEADRAIERAIRERLADAFPAHGLVGEEYGTEQGDAAVRWYIDPIDGTHNFMRGIPLFGMLLAVERDGELQVGIVSAPMLGERWFAMRGGGAWAVDRKGWATPEPRRIGVSSVADLADAQILYGSQGDVADSGKAPGFTAIIRDAWRDRGFGDFWGYALVAEGAAEAMIEADLSAWDLAAPTVIVEEAGGLVTDFTGARDIHRRSALASNGRLHDELLRRLAGPGATD